MESIDRLREHGKSVVDYQWGVGFDKLCDAIEAELAERYVALPLDADGMPIHIGDVLEIERGGSTDIGEVTDIHLQGRKCAVSICFEYDSGATAFPDDFRHHQTDTWERIIEDAMREGHDDDPSNIDVGKYVARCEALAEGGSRVPGPAGRGTACGRAGSGASGASA